MFNTVEGNSCFYAIPPLENVRRWAKETANGFEFCLKFPREISHERSLVQAQRATHEFLGVLEVLAKAERLGPTFLQLGPDFGPDRSQILADYLASLPREFPWAVELRHLDWFDQGTNERLANKILEDAGVDKVIFDSRPLFQSGPEDEIEKASQARKPRTPVRQTVTSDRPMLRIVGRNRIEKTDAYLDQWAPIVARWINEGKIPYIFTHAPDDTFAPELARRFYQKIAALLSDDFKQAGMGELPRLPAKPKQLGLL